MLVHLILEYGYYRWLKEAQASPNAVDPVAVMYSLVLSLSAELLRY